MKKQKKINKIENETRAKFQCPTQLEILIGLAKEFPAQAKTLSQISESIGETHNLWQKTRDFIFEYLKDAPTCLAFVNCLPPFSDADIALVDVPRRYESLRNSIEKLRLLAIYSPEELESRPYLWEKLNPSAGNFSIYRGLVETIGIDLYSSAFIQAREEGKMFFPDRIRSCEICSRIFWANRKDSETCSPDCFNTLRQRRYRERNKEKVNRERRKNYYYKNKIEFCEECVYPLTKYNCGLHCNFS